MLFANGLRRAARIAGCVAVLILIACSKCPAEGPGWLRYAVPPDPPRYHDLPHAVVVLGDAPEEITAAEELDRGVGHMIGGTDIVLHRFDPDFDAIVLGSTNALHGAGLNRLPGWTERALPEESFRIVHLRNGIRHWYILQGGSPRAELWAAFRFAALIAEDQQLPEDMTDAPQLGIRGIEIGGKLSGSLMVAEDQGTGLLRLLASVGFNALITSARGEELIRLCSDARAFGIRVWVRVDAMDTPATENAERLARALPNVAGIVLRLPDTVDRERFKAALLAANASARGLRGRGVAVMVENALGEPLVERKNLNALSPEERALLVRDGLDPGVTISERANSTLVPLAGLGSANFSLLPGRPQIARFELFPAPPDALAYPLQAWQRVLHTPEHQAKSNGFMLDALEAAGPRGGIVASVPLTALAAMAQQPMLQANLYAFGRMAWNPGMRPSAVTEEWARLTWGDDARVYAVAVDILLKSAGLYTANRAPLGLPSLAADGGSPDPAHASIAHGTTVPLAEGTEWGTDRTISGTDEVRRYPAEFAGILSSPSKCPDEWLLIFHRLPYTYRLRDGRTAIQAFYDSHFASAAQITNAMDAWESVDGLVNEPRYRAVYRFLSHAALQAEVWRDTTSEWLQHVSGVNDALDFVGHHPGRVTAEQMQLSGFVPAEEQEPENVSRGSGLRCTKVQCSASTIFRGGENVYRLDVGYFDTPAESTFKLQVNGVTRASWTSDARDGNGSTKTSYKAERFVVNGVRLKPNDKIEVEVVTDQSREALLDFIQVTRDPRWN